MCYNNVIKTLCRTVIALFIVLYGTKAGFAQGTVSLSEGAESEVPSDLSLFEEDLDSGFLSPGKVDAPGNAGNVSLDMLETDVEGNTVGLAETVETVDTINTAGPIGDTAGTVSLEGADNLPVSENNNPVPQAPVTFNDNFGEDLLSQIDDEIFSKMSDIEKQTALLTLELRRERIKTEIEAIKSQRQKAIEVEEEAKELKRREKAEWENEQQRKLIAEQTKLQEAALKVEKLRQEKIINAYKNQMLATNQKWIESLGKAYKQAKDIEIERTEFLDDFKTKMANLSALAQKVGSEAVTAKENYEREIQNLQTQISILNSRIETLNAEKAQAANGTAGVDNPFAMPGFGTSSDPNIRLSDEYIILEIKGKGENLIAKISNISGAEAFLVQKGTTLKSGHVIEEIAPTFIRADKGGEKDFIYFSAGGILDKEPDSELKLKNIFPLGQGNSAGTQSFGGGAAGGSNGQKKEEREKVSNSFIEQMFAD